MALIALVFLSLFIPVQPRQYWDHGRFRERANSEHVTKRIIYLMYAIYTDVMLTVNYTNPERFMYEETMEYETGYVFGEIIERYRKLVIHMRKLWYYKTVTVYEAVGRLEQMQKLYFELQHLINMMHEIPRKYKFVGGIATEAPDPRMQGRGLAGKLGMSQSQLDKLSRQHAKDEALRKKLIEQRQALIKKKRKILQAGLPAGSVGDDTYQNLQGALAPGGAAAGKGKGGYPKDPMNTDLNNLHTALGIMGMQGKLPKLSGWSKNWERDYGWDLDYWD